MIKLKILKKSLSWLLSVGMLTAMSFPAMAAENYGPDGNGVIQPDGTVLHEPSAEQKENGHTTFSIIEAKQNPNNVSFTVPLYVTMAVVEGETEVVVPTNYTIVNTSKSSGVSENGKDPFDIAVVGMEFTKLDGGYNTVATAPAGPAQASGPKEIQLQVGNVTMPAMDTPGTTDVKLRVADSQFLETPASPDASLWKKIAADPAGGANELALDLKGAVAASASLDNKAAAAQFRVKYTVSALDSTGKPLGNVYAGDDRVKAGLGEFTPSP